MKLLRKVSVYLEFLKQYS